MCANGIYKSHWEPLAELHFDLTSNEIQDDTYSYCLCSRVVVSNIAGEQSDDEDFADTNLKCAPPKLKISNLKLNEVNIAQFEGYENFNQYWIVNGEKLVWNTWYQKYSDYIDPTYNKCETKLDNGEKQNENVKIEYDCFMDKEEINQELIDITYDNCFDTSDKNSQLTLDLSVITRNNQRSPSSLPGEDSSPAQFIDKNGDTLALHEKRERKFSYDSKTRKNYENIIKNDNFKRRSDSDLTNSNEKLKTRDLSVKNVPIEGRSFDSMTNITRLSISSFLSTDLEEAKESPKSDACITPNPIEDINHEDYWKAMWDKNIFDTYEQYYAMFINWYGQQNFETFDVVKSSSTYLKSNISDLSETREYSIKTESNRYKNYSIDQYVNEDTHFKDTEFLNGRYKDKAAESAGSQLNSLLIDTPMKNVQIGNNSTGESGDISMDDEICSDPPMDCGEADQKEKAKMETSSGDKGKTSFNGSNHITSSNSLNSSSDDDEKRPDKKRSIKIKRSHEAEFDSVKYRIKKAFRDIGLQFSNSSKMSTFETNRDVLSNNVPDTILQNENDVGSDKSTMEFDFPAELVWRKRRIKKLFRPKRRDHMLQQPSHVYFSDYDEEEQKPNNSSVAINCDNNEVSSECDQTTIREIVTAGSEAVETSVAMETIIDNTRPKKIRRRKNRIKLPPEVEADQSLLKYWKRRWSLFSLFDRGIQLDHESWFSVTPESVAAHTASRLANHIVVDGFCGAGGNSIQFALTCCLVLACDVDPKKIELAEHNATVYGVRDRIQFIVGDFFELAPNLKADAVFLSPPWGGVHYNKCETYDLETMLQPVAASHLMAAAKQISNEIAIYLPRNSDTKQLVQMAGEGSSVEIEQNYLDKRLVALTAYYGDLVCDTNLS